MLFHDVDQLIDADSFRRAEIDGFEDLGVHDQLDALDAVVDEHEAASLVAGAPDLNLVFAADFGFDHFAANGRGSFLAAAVPGSPRSIHIVKSCDAGVEAEILAEMAAHPFAEKLFPAVAVFGQRRVGVFFLQRGGFEGPLLVGVVDAGGGGIEKLLAAVLLRGLEHVRIDQDRQHAQRLVVFDEAHAAHVRGKVIDFVDALGGTFAVFFEIQVERRDSRRRRSADTIRPTV